MRQFLRFILCAVVSLVGCNSVELTRVYVKDSYIAIDEVLQRSFTPQALQVIKDIKIYEGLHICSYVVGVNFWSNFISLVTFNGVGRKIISSQGTLSTDVYSSVVHEYTHHLDDMGRDGEITLIDRAAFQEAFAKMLEDPLTADAAKDILFNADQLVTNLFGIGPFSEEIAYTASWVIKNPDLCPNYMHQVFSRTLKVSYAKCHLDETTKLELN